MQFEVAKSVLLKALGNVNGAVEKKNTIPVLQNVKVEAQNGKVILSATDMDIIVTANFETEMVSNGTTTVPAQMFYDIIRKIPDATKITVTQENPNILNIKSGKSKYNLPCIDASEFPSPSEGELGAEVEVDAEKLAKIIDKARFAISNDETRYYLNGLYLHAVKTDKAYELRAVATDGHRLAVAHLAAEKLNAEFGVIVPKKSVTEIRRIIDGAKKLTVAVSRAKIKIAADHTTIISKLIDGDFPDYTKVLPKNNTQVATVNKRALFDCVDRVSTVASDKHRSVKMSVDKNKITLQINATDGSFAHEELDAVYDGDKIEIGFNSRYLLDVISQVDKEELQFKFKDGNSPALVEANDFNASFVIMPVRI